LIQPNVKPHGFAFAKGHEQGKAEGEDHHRRQEGFYVMETVEQDRVAQRRRGAKSRALREQTDGGSENERSQTFTNDRHVTSQTQCLLVNERPYPGANQYAANSEITTQVHLRDETEKRSDIANVRQLDSYPHEQAAQGG
jgi:hypothetical protein